MEPLEWRAMLATVIQSSFSNINSDVAGGVCNGGLCTPPDTQVAVGPTTLVGAVNTSIVLKNKSGAVLAGSIEFENFFSSVVQPSHVFSDPYTLYDEQAQRFYVGIIEFPNVGNTGRFDLAVSKSDSPATLTAADWHFYQFTSVNEGNTRFPDFPKMGWNNDAIFVSFNQFTNSFTHNLILTIDKSSVLDGGAATSFTTNAFITSSTRILIPARMHNQTTGNLEYFVQKDSNATDTVNVVKMTNYLSATPTFQSTTITVSPYDQSPGVPGLTNQIDDRVLSASWINNRLVASQDVGVGGVNVARWYEFNAPLNGTPTLIQQGNIIPGPGISTSYPSIAINAAGNIAMTYMQNSSTEPTSMYVTGRATSLPLGNMPPGRLVIAGAALAGALRGGDYSATEFDPVTPSSFWSANQYQLDTSGSNFHWGTHIAKYTITGAPFILGSIPTGARIDPVSSVSFTFNEPMNKTSFNVAADVVSFTGPAGDLKPLISGFAWSPDGSALTINFPTQAAPGSYSLVLGPQILNASLNLALDNNANGTSGESPADNFNHAFNLLSVVCEKFDTATVPALPAGWSNESASGNNPWITTTTSSFSNPNNAFVADISTVSDGRLISPPFTYVLANSVMLFQNNYDLETNFDGGVLEISINGGAFQDILAAGGSFNAGGYNSTISTSFSNPIGGRRAWSGNSGGYGLTSVNLPAAAAGQPVQLRWRLGTDNSVPDQGWHIDDVCLPSVPTTLSIAATSADKAEGNVGTTPFTFTVTRSGNVSSSTSVNFTVAGTGINPTNATDFGGAFPSGTVTFNATETSKVITVNVAGDTALEPNDTFRVTLSGATGGATIATASALGTIRNDDTGLSIAATSANKAEGNSSVTPFTFTVTRSGNVSGTTSVNFAVSGTGANPSNAADFGGTLPSGSATFLANETAKVITVNVSGDTIVEPDETFLVTLSGATGGATITSATATGTIRNDDTTLGIAATSADKAEGNAGPTPFTFTVTRSGNVSGSTSVNFGVAGSGASPANAADFSGASFPSGVVTFAANETSKIITVNVSGDTTVEANETFVINLTGASGGATISTPSASGIIRNDDVAGTTLGIAATAADKAEGNAGNTAFTFTVTRGGTLGGSNSVNFAVTGTGANPANAADFGGTFPSGVVTFSGNETSKVIGLNVRADTSVESDETFVVTLSGATGGATIVTPTATGTIRNDDTSLAIAATSADKPEGNTGFTPFTFTVTRTGNISGATNVNFGVAGSGVRPANAADFNAIFPSGTVSFGANETSKVISLNVKGDTTVEFDETFQVSLSAASGGASISTASAIGTIRNDDTSLAIVALSANKLEGNVGNTPFTFTVTRSGNVSGSTTVNFGASGTGAIPANAADFGGVFPSGIVLFNPNETSKVVTVNATGDTVVESDETFRVLLSGASGGETITTSSAVGTIRNDDTGFSIAALSADKAEGNSGTTVFTYTVTRSGVTSGTNTVNFSVGPSGANPVNATDFGGAFPSGSLTLNANETSKTVSVNVSGDANVEPDENFLISLSNPTGGATIGNGTALGTIRNDDTSVAISALSANKAEGNSGNLAFTFTVTRNGLATGITTVNFTVAGSGASPANGADFSGGSFPSGTITFNANETSRIITLNVRGDTEIEPNEDFQVTLSNASGGATIATATATGTIVNDDTTPGNQVLDCDALHVGANLCTFSGATPGGIATFVQGSQPGSTPIPSLGITLGISSPIFIGQSIIDSNGEASVIVDLPPSAFGQVVLLQGFEQAPNPRVSNVVSQSVALIAEKPMLTVRGQPGQSPSAPGLAAADVDRIFKHAKDMWRAIGLTAAELQSLQQATVRIADLVSTGLGLTSGTVITVDANAADVGWFVDPTPDLTEEFKIEKEANEPGVYQAVEDRGAENRIDLLTVVLHELGHVIGRDVEVTPLMEESLRAGRRKLPVG